MRLMGAAQDSFAGAFAVAAVTGIVISVIAAIVVAMLRNASGH